jgi:hypothetical protein
LDGGAPCSYERLVQRRLRALTGLQRGADGAIRWFRNDIQHPGA